jgi:phosphoglycerate dehydrogenase-like enzyme
MKIKGAFFLKSGSNNINRVYSRRSRRIIQEHVDMTPGVINTENIQKRVDDVQGIEAAFSTWGMPVFSAEEIGRYFPKLKVLFYGAGSVQRFARPFLEQGITVVSAWGANGVPVAEYTASLILLVNKGFFPVLNTYTANGHREARTLSEGFPGNYRTKTGIVGAGMIGSLVIKLLNKTDLDLMVFDPYLPDADAEALGVKKVSLEELFASCQTISNHLANLPATKGILNKTLFERMPETAAFINTGRGAQVVEADLVEALKEEPGRTAILDVTDPEPVPADSELLRMPNVIITPHIAGSTGSEVMRMGDYMAEELVRYIRGTNLKYAVTLSMLERMA